MAISEIQTNIVHLVPQIEDEDAEREMELESGPAGCRAALIRAMLRVHQDILILGYDSDGALMIEANPYLSKRSNILWLIEQLKRMMLDPEMGF